MTSGGRLAIVISSLTEIRLHLNSKWESADMDQRPLISLILLCYNHERFVAEAVDSVLEQTYSPLEIVIIDDCSLDRTAGIITERLDAHPSRSRVKFVRNPKNMTGKVSTEIGLSITEGEFVVIV